MEKLKQSKEFLEKKLEFFTKEDTKKLQEIIKYHSDLYYNKQQPIISDKQYDELFKKLEFLEKKYKNGLKEFVTTKVGADLIESSFEKVRHSRPMISLDNTYNEEDLRDFDERVKKNIGDKNINKIEYTIEYKFDGLGIELIYKNGEFVQAITRGNGIEGEDVTENVRQIKNIPKKIDYKEDLEVRGEVIMPISSFKKLNKEALENQEKVFSNPRNAASGSLRVKDINITKKRNLKFFAYDLANFEDFIKNNSLNKYNQVIKKLKKLGFEISDYFEVCNGIEEVIKKIKNFGDRKKYLDFEIDGLVIKVNDISLWDKIGYTEHHPKYAIAYKFPAEIFTTKILSVDHQVGKTGTITPVANLEAVDMGGAIIKRATLHNYDEVEKLGIMIGDYVFIKRAGEVIPKIISLASKGEKREQILPPKYCPSCDSLVKKDKVRYYCPNSSECPAQHYEKLVYAVSKDAFDIDGLGEKQIKLFLEEGIIQSLVDIFKLEEKKDLILSLEGFKEKSVENIINAVKKAKKVSIEKLLVALSIQGVGKKTAKIISKLFKNKENLLNFSYSLEELEKLPDIGPEIAKNIIDYFRNEAHKRLLNDLLKVIELECYKEKEIKTSFFTGKKVCITGSFIGENGEKISRDNLVKKLEEVGGIFVNSVSKNTDFLLAGEKAGSKLEKAKKLGVKIINLEEFLEKIGN